MTCRHAANDPSCSSHKDYHLYRGTAPPAPATPDAGSFQVQEAEQVGRHLVMRVLYPNCSRCSYEGAKVMVFLDRTALQALRWRRIDPHFREPGKEADGEAPGPAARFPASPEGWSDAHAFAAARGAARTPR